MNIKNIYTSSLLLMILYSCTVKENVDYKKYDLLTSPKEISEFYNIALDTSGLSESASITKWTDGAFELRYSYNLPNSEKYNPLIYFIKISKKTSVDEAKTSFSVTKTKLHNTWISDSEQSVKVIDNIVLSGEQNYYAIRQLNNEPNGVFFVVRKKDIVYSLIMTGFYTNDHSLITSLIEPDIKNLENFKIIE